MKIGILTFHCAHNFGAVLQCYALQETLKTMGHEVYIIDYRPDYLIKPYKIFSLHRLKSKNPLKCIFKMMVELSSIQARKIRKRGFDQFINSRFQLFPISRLSEDSHFDLFIFGSDQIWNPKFNHYKLDPIFLGCSSVFSDTPKIAYAASMGMKELPNKQIEKEFSNALQSFRSISVRERSFQDYIEKVSGLKSKTVIDPTLLLTSLQYDRLIGKKMIQEDYILVYQIAGSVSLTQNISVLQKSLRKKVIDISPFSRKGLKYSPYDFLNLIKYADLILTTSFHGTVFSCIFQKDFYTFSINKDIDNRSKNLLESLSLEERMIKDISEINSKHIDYEIINKSIKMLQSEAIKWLIENLKG